MQAVGANNNNNNTSSALSSQNYSQVVIGELMGILKSFGDAIVNHWQEESDARYAGTLTVQDVSSGKRSNFNSGWQMRD